MSSWYYILGLLVSVIILVIPFGCYLHSKSLKSRPANEENPTEVCIYSNTTDSPSVSFVSFAGGGEVHRANQALQKIPNEKFIPNLRCAYYENDSTIGPEYYNKLSPNLRNSTRGFHYWSWKPYIVLKTMLKEPNNTVIVYLDSGAYFKSTIKPLITMADKYGRIFFNNFHDNTKYCKCEPVNAQLHSNTERRRFLETLQLDAALIVLKNTTENQNFVKKWLDLCMIHSFVSDSKSLNCEEIHDFADHRHDQALLTLVAFMNPAGQTFLDNAKKNEFIIHHRRRSL